MHWNYRVILHTEGQEPFVAIHEVYYNEEGEPDSWSEEPVHVQGDDLNELRNDLIYQLTALTKPTLRIESGWEGDVPVEWLEEVAE